jgi:hypothetical protein
MFQSLDFCAVKVKFRRGFWMEWRVGTELDFREWRQSEGQSLKLASWSRTGTELEMKGARDRA